MPKKTMEKKSTVKQQIADDKPKNFETKNVKIKEQLIKYGYNIIEIKSPEPLTYVFDIDEESAKKLL